MDYLSPLYRRNCEVIGSKGVVTWDYNSGKVAIILKREPKPQIIDQPASFKKNTMFVDHMKHFLGRIKNGGSAAVDLKDGIDVLKVALASHKSSETRRAVKPSEIKTQ